ncbi:hypothetical protein C8J56DRAFT_1065154 [Mycena floridula]|nr:hypothetical protein C8J56DRAFT_1065154 [Mycena floridula]
MQLDDRYNETGQDDWGWNLGKVALGNPTTGAATWLRLFHSAQSSSTFYCLDTANTSRPWITFASKLSCRLGLLDIVFTKIQDTLLLFLHLRHHRPPPPPRSRSEGQLDTVGKDSELRQAESKTIENSHGRTFSKLWLALWLERLLFHEKSLWSLFVGKASPTDDDMPTRRMSTNEMERRSMERPERQLFAAVSSLYVKVLFLCGAHNYVLHLVFMRDGFIEETQGERSRRKSKSFHPSLSYMMNLLSFALIMAAYSIPCKEEIRALY